MAGEATITATSIVKPDLKASCSLIINGEIGKIEFVNQEEALIEIVENTLTQLEVKLTTSDGLETVEKDIEWYEEYLRGLQSCLFTAVMAASLDTIQTETARLMMLQMNLDT